MSAKALRVTGMGAVSPCGWGSAMLRGDAIHGAPEAMEIYGGTRALVRRVPGNDALKHLDQGRFRKVAGITKFAIEAARECLGDKALSPEATVIVAVSAGSITYSEQFFAPMARNKTELPFPQFFPETVFNAACSHLCAFLGHPGPSYALVGDATVGFEALALARDLILNCRTPECLVVVAEEISALQIAGVSRHVRIATADAPHNGMVFAEGSCALRLAPDDPRDAGCSRIWGCSVEPARDIPALGQNLKRQLSALRSGVSVPLELYGGWMGGPFDRLERAVASHFSPKTSTPFSEAGEAFPVSALWRMMEACRSRSTVLLTTMGLHRRSAAALVGVSL